MSNCIKNLFDYELAEKSSKCGDNFLKSNFYAHKVPKHKLYLN